MSSHRGLSAVVGTVFLVAVVIGALSYVSYSLELMGNFSESLIVEESRQQDKQNEAFEISSIDLSTSTLNGVIKNSGDLPIELTTLYIDEQGVNDVVQKYDLDAEIAPGETINLLDFTNIPVDSTTGYNMKVVSSRGAVNTFYVNSNGQENIGISLMAIPESIVTGFETTLLMTVVNNMSNNNILVNLTPEDPYPGCSTDGNCRLISGPTPTSYDVLDSGDTAIFRWSYELLGDDGDTFTFTGAAQNGFPGNDDTAVVTIDVPEFAENSGVSLESLGFGQSTTIENVFVFHAEDYGIPAGIEYQLTPLTPDTSGTDLTITSGTVLDFMSSNVTVSDAHFPAGNWNASLRYYHDHLPAGMSAGSSEIWENSNAEDTGIKLHFEDVSTSTGIYISTEESYCYNLETLESTSTNGGIQWSPTMGVNGSGAYYFDGINDYIIIEGRNHDTGCANPHNAGFSIAVWFRSTADISHIDEQTILETWDTSGAGDYGGYRIELGDGGATHRGVVFFTFMDDNGNTLRCESFGDSGTGSLDYADGEWHHVVATMASNDHCYLYVDGVEVDDDGSLGYHFDGDDDLYIGSDEGGTNDLFIGYIDDVLIWAEHTLTAGDVTILKNHSFGYNATNMHFSLGNYTDAGTLSNSIAYSNDYGLKWGDQGHYTDEWDEYRGGNYTISLPEVRLNLDQDNNRLGFSMEYASGDDLYFKMDDNTLDGNESVEYDLSSYLQPTTLPDSQVLPVFYTWDNDNAIVEFFAYSAGEKGSWFTFQGTRIIFNGTNGHYAGLIKTISDGTDTITMSVSEDSPYIPADTTADFVFHAPQKNPQDAAPSTPDKIPTGNYDVNIFLNGYDEEGQVFIRSVSIGTIEVLE